MNKNISFNKPFISNYEIKNIKKLLLKNYYSAGGYFSKKCSNWLKNNIGCKEALMVNSCTGALEICALLLNIRSGDQVIMPSYTFVSTANAFVLRGGLPVFVDIDPKTLNIDVNKIEKAITKKTKAIVVVHYAGVSCDMDLILKIAKKYKLYVIEDAAQAILSRYKNKTLGSIGDLATLSFHDSKNIHCGEGGALLINNKKFINRSKIIMNKGTNRNDFDKKIVNKYTWVDIGSSYGLSEINCAFLYAQLKKTNEIINKRLKLWKIYYDFFSKYQNIVSVPHIPPKVKHNAHIFYLILKKYNRNLLLKILNKKKINSIFHYIPLHNSPYGKINCKYSENMNVTNMIARKLIRLPLHNSITNQDILRVKKVFKKIFKYNL